MTKILESDIQEICGRLALYESELREKKVLLTGCYGFLGSYFLRVLEKFDCVVVGMDNFIATQRTGTQHKNFAFLQHDVSKPFPPDLAMDFDLVIASAGIASPKYYSQFPLETIESAIAGAKNCLEIAKTCQAKILCFSSSEVYSGSTKMPLVEEDNGDVSTMCERAPYDISKKLLETLVFVYCNKYQVHANLIRPFNFYSGALGIGDGRVLSTFAQKIQNDQPLTIYGDGSQTRSMTYITDGIVGSFQILLSQTKGEVYNIGNPDEITMLELAHKVQSLVQKPTSIQMIERPSHYLTEPLRRVPCIEKAKKMLGFEARVSTDEGLKRFYSALSL